ncbi:MAG TPA: class I SAM-dependent methyltransferase [Anaerolineaceae bacterium]|nr:class I SAM-dependent methyltransferase [Anaerolineaceae bacterium]
MSKIQSLADPEYVNQQYRNASNLNARIRLHQAFSTNKYGWPRWLFDQFKLKPKMRVLELGCGAGNLWLENLDRVPSAMEITLSDFSAGMLAQAQRNLGNSHLFQFKVIDAQSIPFDPRHFDLVIASHMLYHVPDREKALSEIKRVLKPSGRFYASTSGGNHLKELTDLVSRFDDQLSAWGTLVADTFNFENGAAQLSAYFADVTLYRYPDSLLVNDANMLVEYILSGRITLTAGRQAELVKFVQQALEDNDGKFYITKESGVFEARSR